MEEILCSIPDKRRLWDSLKTLKSSITITNWSFEYFLRFLQPFKIKSCPYFFGTPCILLDFCKQWEKSWNLLSIQCKKVVLFQQTAKNVLIISRCKDTFSCISMRTSHGRCDTIYNPVCIWWPKSLFFNYCKRKVLSSIQPNLHVKGFPKDTTFRLKVFEGFPSLQPSGTIFLKVLQRIQPSGWRFLKDFQVCNLQGWFFLMYTKTFF